MSVKVVVGGTSVGASLDNVVEHQLVCLFVCFCDVFFRSWCGSLELPKDNQKSPRLLPPGFAFYIGTTVRGSRPPFSSIPMFSQLPSTVLESQGFDQGLLASNHFVHVCSVEVFVVPIGCFFGALANNTAGLRRAFHSPLAA